MKKVIKQSLRDIAVKVLIDFGYEKDKSHAIVEPYADSLTEQFERYLKAYNDFKED